MLHLPVFIRNLEGGHFVPENQHGFYHLLLIIKQMRIHAGPVEKLTEHDGRPVAF